MMYPRPSPPPRPLSPYAGELEVAMWNERFAGNTLDQQWLLRDHYQGIENTKRQRDWADRFRILGPWR